MANKAAPLTYYVETAPGLEEVAWLEIRRRLPDAQFREFLFARDERGIVVFDSRATPSELFALRTINALFLAGAYLSSTGRGYRDLRQLREQMVGTGDFGRAVNVFSRHRRRQAGSYRLIVRTYGQLEYNRQDVRRAVIQGIEALYPTWQRDQEEPDVEVWANVLGSTILLGLRLPYKGATAPTDTGALPAPVAEALVLLTEPQAEDRFLDPFPHHGEIVSARVGFPATELFAAGEVAPLPQESELVLTTVRWQGARLSLPDGAADKLATRMPSVSESKLMAQYVGWLNELARVLQPGARAVIFTHAFDAFKDAIREAPLLEIRGGYSLTVADEWGRIYLLQRLDAAA